MEKVYYFEQSEEKLVEKILDDDVAMINHMILNQGEEIPQHDSNSNVYMLILCGIMTIKLGESPVKDYKHGSIINIPGSVRMDISNTHPEQLEFFVVKAPSPRLYK